MAYTQYAPKTNNFGTNQNRYGSGQKSSNSRKSQDIETAGVLLHNDRVGKYLKTRFWNKCMGIDIGSYQAGTQINYDTIRNGQTFGHVFSFSTIFELKEICEDILESLKNTNRFESMATEAGQKKDVIIEISNGSNINMPAGIYLVIYKSVDSGKRTNIMEVYPFNSTKVLLNYNHVTGAATEDIKATGEFKKFVKCLDEAANALTMAQAHAVAEVKKGDKMATFNALSAIAAGLGVDFSKIVTSSSRTNGQASYNKQQPQNFQRQSTPGQWNRGGQYGQQRNYQNQQQPQQVQAAMAAMNDEPVDLNMDVMDLQNVTLEDFK